MEDALIRQLREKAENFYREGDYLCSEAIFTVVNDYFGRPLPPEAVRLSSGFPVGMGTAGCTCGALAGAIMALGLKYGRRGPKEDNTRIMELSKEIHDEFKKRFGQTCCRSLIRAFEFGSPAHLEHCTMITGETTAMVLRRLTEE